MNSKMRAGSQTVQRRITRSQRGASLVELMVAMLVLAVGLLGPVVLISTAISTDNRTKLDTNGTLLAQTILEQIATHSSSGPATFTITDCRPAAQGGPQTWTIDTTAANSPGAGGNLNSSNYIDFTQAYTAVPANYKMQYVACTPDAQAVYTYDIRWNIRKVDAFTKLVTVAARTTLAAGVPANDQVSFYSPPVSLRTLVGN